DREIEIVRLDPGQGLRKRLACRRKKVIPEGPAAADLVFPEPRLRFMDAKRRRRSGGRAKVFRIESLLVDAVPRLVQDAEECIVEMAGVIPGRDAAIARAHAAAKRMRGDIEAAGLEAEADLAGDRLAERFLLLHGVFAFENFPRRLSARIHDAADER